MATSSGVKIFALALMLCLLSACAAQDDGVDQGDIDSSLNILQPDEGSPLITPTPFLPQTMTTPIVNDDVAIRAALIERFGVSEDEADIALAANTGLHAKGEVGEEYFLAYKEENSWIILYVGLANPPCQAIFSAQFPVEMVPECVDEENNTVIRIPETEAAIRIALADRLGVGTEEMEISIIETSGVYLYGSVNNGYFFAVNKNGSWQIVHDGQATPPCKEINSHKFPTDMVPECLDKNNILVTR